MKFDVLILGENIDPRLLVTLKNNQSFIRTIFSTTPLPFPNNLVVTPCSNLVTTLNQMLAHASHHTIWFQGSSNPDEELFEEYAHILQHASFDLIYPNYITKKGIKNFHNWENKNLELLQTFNIEKEIPHWGIYYKNDSFLDPQMDSFAFYDKLYCNITNLRITLADTIFVEEQMREFSDKSYKSKTLRKIIEIYDFQKELFTHLDWKREKIAQATAYTLIGNLLFELKDYFNASVHFHQALNIFHNRLSAQNLIRSYIQMGLFNDAKNLVKTQLDKDQEVWLEQIENFHTLIYQLEKKVQNNQIEELQKIKKDLFNIYDGALLYNIYGVIEFHMQNYTDAYNNFYNAAYRNPIDPDILQNIAMAAKKINKEDQVIALYERTTT